MRIIAGILSLILGVYAMSFLTQINVGWVLQFNRNAGACWYVSAWWTVLPFAYGLYCIVVGEIEELRRKHKKQD